MELIVKITNVYGRETIYPACEKSKKLARLAGQITLTKKTIDIIRELGYTIKIQAQAFNK